MTARSDDLPDGVGGDEMGGALVPDTSSDDALGAFLGDLRVLGRGPVPEPSAPLAALLAGAVLIDPYRHRDRHRMAPRRVVHRSARAVAAVAVVLTSIAAVRHELPAPAQHVVSDVVKHVNPFHIQAVPQGAGPALRAPASLPASSRPTIHAAPNGNTIRLKAPKPKAKHQVVAAAPVAKAAPVVTHQRAATVASGGGVTVHQIKITVRVRVVHTSTVSSRQVHFTAPVVQSRVHYARVYPVRG